MKKIYTLHPYLFVLYCVLAIITNNITDININSLRVIMFSTIACTVVLLFFYIVLRDVVKASLISSVAILLIFSFGHVKALILANSNSDPTILILFLTIIWWVIFLGWIYVVLKILKSYETLTKYLLTISIILLMFPLYSIFGFYFQRIGKEQRVNSFLQDSWDQYGVTEAERMVKVSLSQPDIYYIVLDSYARSDILDELYGYDNRDFNVSLKNRGFYVANKSRSNYSHTSFSLSSTLNMMLINTLPDYVTRGFNFNKEWLIKEASIDTLQRNRLMEILKQQGYKIASFDTGFESINFPDADYHMVPPAVGNSIYTSKNLFEIFFLDTFVGELIKITDESEDTMVSSMYDAHRERIMYIFDNLHQFAGKDGQYFVFAHVIAPHPPYVFGPNGEEIGGDEVFTLDDVAKSNRDHELYIGELQYINMLVLETIDRIMDESDVSPIIIIQSDHGSRLYPDNYSAHDVQDKVLFPILNAYYLPGVDTESIFYPSITPVNSFRIVLNKYFDTNLELLEDRSFDWNSYTDYEFILACAHQECY